MTKQQHMFMLGLIVVPILGLAIGGPHLRRDNSKIDPGILYELRSEATISWDAPLLELLTQQVPRVDSYDPQTRVAVIGMYSWFGVRIGGARLEGCQYGKPGNWNPNFGCYGGGFAEYGLSL